MIIRPKGKRLKITVIALVDSTNSSATFGFAQILKNIGLATLIGETTGGNRRGINGGAFSFLRLPASGIGVDIPLIGYFPQSQEPDIAVEITPADIAAGYDRAMATALQVAGRGCQRLALFAFIAARTRALKAAALIVSPSRMSMARRALPSRLALKRFLGSASAAPLAKVNLTTTL